MIEHYKLPLVNSLLNEISSLTEPHSKETFQDSTMPALDDEPFHQPLYAKGKSMTVSSIRIESPSILSTHENRNTCRCPSSVSQLQTFSASSVDGARRTG